MTRTQQSDHNRQVIHSVINLVNQHQRYSPPAYKVIVDQLNAKGLLTTRGNFWTPQRLFRMLQRNGYGGLHGLKQTMHVKSERGSVKPVSCSPFEAFA
jgi:hypothetical protein